MKFELENFHRYVPDQSLVEDLIRVANQINKDKVTIDEYNERGQFHSTTLTRRFGSWFKALELAGLKKTRNLNIKNEELFSNLVEVWTLLGRQPKYSDLTREYSKYSSGTYENRFGTWRKALEAFVIWVNDNKLPVKEEKVGLKGRKTPRNINWRLRAMVLMKDGARCKLCGATPQDGIKLHVDHIVPWSRGGETVFENLQILCDRCNIGKSDTNLTQDARLKNE